MKKFKKAAAVFLAAACAFSQIGAISVSAAAQKLPFTEDFETGTISASKGWSYTGGVTAESKAAVFPKGATSTLTLDFDKVDSGVLVIEADLHIERVQSTDLVTVNTADGDKLLSLFVDGRGANGSYTNMKDNNVTKLNNVNWGASVKNFQLKFEIDFENNNWKFWQNHSGKENQLKYVNGGATEFPFASGDVSDAAQIVFKSVLPADAPENIIFDNIKVYKKLTATQSETSKTMLVGSTEKAGVTVTPTGDVVGDMKWESSDEAVCTVDNSGNITAHTVGTATVRAKSAFYGLNFSYAIVVKNAATAISLEKSAMTMPVGESKILNYTLTPADSAAGTLTWTSTNESVADVDANGKVTALSDGTATITVTGANGVTDSCDVTVIIPPETISLTGISGTMQTGDSAMLNVGFTPATATVDIDSMKWRTSNHYVAKVSSDGKVTAVGKGVADIYVSYANLTAKFTVTVAGDDSEKKSPLISYIEKGASFADIADMKWAQDAVQSVAASGIMTADSDNSFGAKRNIKRDEFVSVVIKTLKLENKKAKNPIEKTFEDVGEENVYYKEIMKGVELGIIEGVSDTSFAPNADITRQDMAVVICKALEAASIKTVEGRLDFADKDEIAEYAQKSVRVLSKMGVIVGKSDNMFDPLANTTRAEAAVLSTKISALR